MHVYKLMNAREFISVVCSVLYNIYLWLNIIYYGVCMLICVLICSLHITCHILYFFYFVLLYTFGTYCFVIISLLYLHEYKLVVVLNSLLIIMIYRQLATVLFVYIWRHVKMWFNTVLLILYHEMSYLNVCMFIVVMILYILWA